MLLLGVSGLVADEMGALAQGLPALGVAIGLLACVALRVHQEARASAEGLAALRAHVGLHPSVHPLVQIRWELHVKAFLHSLHPHDFSRVHSLVDHESGALAEGLATLSTRGEIFAGGKKCFVCFFNFHIPPDKKETRLEMHHARK